MDIRLAKSNGATTVTTVGTHVDATGTAPNPTAGRSGVVLANLSGDWRITSTNSTNTPLPIELVYFKGEVIGENVQLTWETASELNNDFFTIERSSDAEVWDELMQVAGAGTSNKTNNYQVQDGRPISGTSYYRLKQTDFDGHFEYSSIVSVNFTGKSDFIVSPNPSTGLFTINNIELVSNQVRLYNGLGQELDIPANSSNSGTILDLSAFPSGIYILQISNGSSLQSVRLMKK